MKLSLDDRKVYITSVKNALIALKKAEFTKLSFLEVEALLSAIMGLKDLMKLLEAEESDGDSV